jgi:four helix bundle protein
MTPEELKKRLTAFGIDVVRFCRQLRALPEARSIAAQLSDCGTAISSNYRAACRARSRREFISRLAVAVEEADEAVGWFKIVRGAELATGSEVTRLFQEAQEILSILAASRRTAEQRDRKNRTVGSAGPPGRQAT